MQQIAYAYAADERTQEDLRFCSASQFLHEKCQASIGMCAFVIWDANITFQRVELLIYYL